MAERRDMPEREERPADGEGESRTGYEAPQLIVLGTFHELTRQQLKISGSSDFSSFQPSHP
jgi:hypothetical protein